MQGLRHPFLEQWKSDGLTKFLSGSHFYFHTHKTSGDEKGWSALPKFIPIGFNDANHTDDPSNAISDDDDDALPPKLIRTPKL